MLQNTFFLEFSWAFRVLSEILKKSYLERYIQLSFMRVCKYLNQRVRRIGKYNNKSMGFSKTKGKKTHGEIEFHNSFICLWTVDQHCKGIFLVQCWPSHTKASFYRLFFREKMNMCFGPTLHKLFSWTMLCHDILRQLWFDDILMQCCEPLRQHSTENFYLCNGIKTTLNRTFSYAMLSGASRTTLQ